MQRRETSIRLEKTENKSGGEDRRDGLEELEGTRLILDLLSRVAAFPVETLFSLFRRPSNHCTFLATCSDGKRLT